MIAAHWFSYAGDEEVLLSSVVAFNTACPGASLVVIDDGNNPCTANVKHEAELLGVEWRVSYWNRKGNLNGLECILGILGEMAQSMFAGASQCVKVDCDTLVLRSDWLNNTSGMIGADDRGGIYGCCYALTGFVVMGLLESFYKHPVTDDAPEDMSIGYRYRALYGEPSLIPLKKTDSDCLGNGSHGIVIPYNWDYDDPNLYRKYSVVNCGNLMKEHGITSEKRAEVMRSIVSRN